MKLPERTKLISLSPCCLNSPYVESMTSYIKRHAEELRVTTGVFIKYVIGSEIKDPYLVADIMRGATRFIERSPTINGVHQLAESCVNMFERLTKLTQLDQLTLLNWKSRISTSDLIKKKLSWCPKCLHQWHENNDILYEPLYWMISGITICPIHHCYLQEQCPSCNREIRVLMNTSKIGFCSFCNESLYKVMNTNVTPQSFELEASLYIINMLLTPNFKHNPNSFIKEWVDAYWDGCCLKAAKASGIPFSTLLDWYKNIGFIPLPRFGEFLKIYFKINKPSHSCLNDTTFYNQKFQIPKKPPTITEHYDKVYSVLQSCINAEPPISLQAAVNRTSFSRKTINKHYPELSRIIKEKYADHVSKSAKLKLELLCQEITNATYEIASAGGYPSCKVVQRKIGKIGSVKRKEVREAWRKAKYQLGVDPRYRASFKSNNMMSGVDINDDG